MQFQNVVQDGLEHEVEEALHELEAQEDHVQQQALDEALEGDVEELLKEIP